MISKWKKILSYLYDIPLESVRGRDGVILNVCLSKGQYQLYTKHAIYSYGSRYANFYKLFKKMRIKESPPGEVLLLGMGLGSIPYMLERDFGVVANYTAVEYDEEVIALASKYVLGALNAPVSVLHTDAAAYVSYSEGRYDMICVDIFVDDVIPPVFQSISFLKSVQNLLAPGGILIFNRLYRDAHAKADTRRYYSSVFKQVFPEAQKIVLDLNAMLVGTNNT